MIDKPVVAALKRIRKLLVEKGWIQGQLRTAEGRCLIGAMCDACFNASVGRVHAILKVTARTSSLGHWNDAKGRTKRHVLALIDKAIRRAEA